MDAGKAAFLHRLHVTQWSRISLTPHQKVAHSRSSTYDADICLHTVLFVCLSLRIPVPTFSWISGVSRYLQSTVKVSRVFAGFLRGTLLSKVSCDQSEAVIVKAVLNGLLVYSSL